VEEPDGPVVQECVEGFLYATPPLELLLFRRPPARGRIWVPVSGKVDPTDADYEAAIRRELREETALVEPRRLHPLDWHIRFRADNGEVWRLHAFGVEVARDFVPTLSPEHDAFRWLDVAAARSLLHFEDNRLAVDRLERQLSPNV
jgi:lipoyl(octanoyl) transferase